MQKIGFLKVCVLTSDMRVICASGGDKKDEPKLWQDENKNFVSEHESFKEDWTGATDFNMFHLKFKVLKGDKVSCVAGSHNNALVCRRTKNYIVVAYGITKEEDPEGKENRTAPFTDAQDAYDKADKRLFREIYVMDAIAKGGDETKEELEAMFKKEIDGQKWPKEEDEEKNNAWAEAKKTSLINKAADIVEAGIERIKKTDTDGAYKYTVSVTLLEATNYRKLATMMTPETDYGNTASYATDDLTAISDFRIFRRIETFD